MRVKFLMLFTLSVLVFACNENVDMQPNANLQQQAGTVEELGDPIEPDYGIITNFVLVNGGTVEANLNFGITPQVNQVVTIKPKLSVKVPGSNVFNPLPPFYSDLVIQPNQTLSNVLSIKVEDILVCDDNFTLRVEVDEMRMGGNLLPAAYYSISSVGPNGVADLEMTGPGCPPEGQGQPGYVSGSDFVKKVSDKILSGN